jgi:hypothetical protein
MGRPQVNGQAAWSTTVSAPATTYNDVTPASSVPVTYIYYVRAVDSANLLSAVEASTMPPRQRCCTRRRR